MGDGEIFVASDAAPIVEYTNKVVYLEDGELAVLRRDGFEVRTIDDVPLTKKVRELSLSLDEIEKGGFPHFMLKEIHEQPQVARELLHLLDARADVGPLVERMRDVRHLYLIGCGTSSHAASVGFFKDRDTYEANAGSPEQHERYLKFRSFLVEDPEWNDGAIVSATGPNAKG